MLPYLHIKLYDKRERVIILISPLPPPPFYPYIWKSLGQDGALNHSKHVFWKSASKLNFM